MQKEQVIDSRIWVHDFKNTPMLLNCHPGHFVCISFMAQGKHTEIRCTSLRETCAQTIPKMQFESRLSCHEYYTQFIRFIFLFKVCLHHIKNCITWSVWAEYMEKYKIFIVWSINKKKLFSFLKRIDARWRVSSGQNKCTSLFQKWSFSFGQSVTQRTF